jgi:hypothetical protein
MKTISAIANTFLALVLAAAWSAFLLGTADAQTIPLGNLFDDPKLTDLVTAISTDTYGADADATDLGIVDFGANLGDHGGTGTVIAPGVRFNFGNVGGADDSPGDPVINDSTFGFNEGQLRPISTTGLQCCGDPAPEIEEGIGIHANKFVTFDLDEIRTAGGFPADTPFGLSGKGAVNDDAIGSPAQFHTVALVSDATNRVTSGYIQGILTPLQNLGVQEFAGPIPPTLRGTGTLSATFSFSIPGSARYLTLASTSSGNIDADHAVFADIEITVSEALPPKTIAYGDFGPLPTGVTFLDVQESSGTDEIPLYGPPTALATGLDFNPAAFAAAGSAGDADLTDGQLNFTVMSVGINSINVADAGDFTLIGTGTAATQVAAGAIIHSTVTQINGVNVAPIILAPSTSSAGFNLLANPGAQQPWLLSTPINVAGQLAALGYGPNDRATKVDVAINNQLTAISEPATSAAAFKRDFVITVESRVPEPSAMGLAGLALCGMAARLCRERRWPTR